MIRRTARRWPLLAVLSVLLLSGCSNKDGTDAPQPPNPLFGQVLPDFSLPDVNPNSPSHGEEISPRAFLGDVSCWYFGHAT